MNPLAALTTLAVVATALITPSEAGYGMPPQQVYTCQGAPFSAPFVVEAYGHAQRLCSRFPGGGCRPVVSSGYSYDSFVRGPGFTCHSGYNIKFCGPQNLIQPYCSGLKGFSACTVPRYFQRYRQSPAIGYGGVVAGGGGAGYGAPGY
ncbi:MAG: hypothetical protein DHS80DRAFT_31229 [Piptocephalis tieghemiana]|nr:MAG: hypothetical protein DHS80DRAFT_31229 [Piptocephalis tieghemiana]